jgi:hypothetical protein
MALATRPPTICKILFRPTDNCESALTVNVSPSVRPMATTASDLVADGYFERRSSISQTHGHIATTKKNAAG